jgi:hypothetical protein
MLYVCAAIAAAAVASILIQQHKILSSIFYGTYGCSLSGTLSAVKRRPPGSLPLHICHVLCVPFHQRHRGCKPVYIANWFKTAFEILQFESSQIITSKI